MRLAQYIVTMVPTAYAWGSDGHNIIVSWAMGLMSEKGRKYLTNQVGSSMEDLSRAATWADTPRALSKYPQSESHHFSHTPYRDCQPFKMERDCGFPGSEGECIVTGLADAIELAMDTTATWELRQDAVKFILHFMGDTHQPLHVGFREDFGGTAIKLKEGKSLHEFWDNDLIAIHKGRSNWLAVADKYRSGFTADHIARMGTSHDMETVLSSSAEVIKYASWLASDTAVTTTCKFGYVDEVGGWIKAGQSLTKKYIENRTPVMIMALSKAAIRLAHLVDGIAIALADDKKSPPALQSGRKEAKLFGTKIKADPTFNTFEILYFDDIEPPVENKAVNAESTVSQKEAEKKEKPSSRKKGKNGKGKAKDDDDFEQVLAQLEAEKRNTFEGIDLTKIQLLNSDGTDFITSIANSKIPEYQPLSVITFRVAFNKNGFQEPKMYIFDGSVFETNISKELAVRCILRVSGVPVNGESNIDRYWNPSTSGTSHVERASGRPAGLVYEPPDGASFEVKMAARLNEEFHKQVLAHRRNLTSIRLAKIKSKFEKWLKSKKSNGSQRLTIADMWKENIEMNRSKIASFRVSSVHIFVLEDTLTKPGPYMRFPMYTSVQKNGDFLRIMIDPAIYEEVEGSDLFRILSDINDENLAYSEAVKAYRPTWMDELHDLDVALNGKDENRNINFRVFRHFVIYDTGIKTALNVEWSIEGEPTEEIYPPTWDQARETQRIRAELLAEQAKAPVLSRKLPDSKQLTSKKPNSGIDISKKNTSKDQEKVTKPIQGSSNVIPVSKTTPNPDQGTSI